uniref:Uncharacterized protein n=1 Tax=Arundo donax TaxID=35708 RepID=A0A0A9CQB0_ARUDO
MLPFFINLSLPTEMTRI